MFFSLPLKKKEWSFPLIPSGLQKGVLPARMSPASQLEVSAWVFVLSMWVPTIYKLIHPLAVIQCWDSACWLMDWRKPVIHNSEEAMGEQAYPPFSHQSPCSKTLQWFRAVSFTLEEWCEPSLDQPHFCTSSHNWLNGQKQQNPYTQETKGSGDRRNMCKVKQPQCGYDYKATCLSLETVWKVRGLEMGLHF